MNLQESYRPNEHEEYMNPLQLAYFETVLKEKRNDLILCAVSAKNELKETWLRGPDIFDVATSQTDIALDLGDLERQRAQIVKIERALAKIKTGDYGYCELSGEKIGLQRLMAQPFATLCIEVQESMERASRGHRVAPGMEEMAFGF